MSRIRGKHTTPEMRVRSLLHRLGYRFRLHVRIPVAPARNAERGTRNTLSASTGEVPSPLWGDLSPLGMGERNWLKAKARRAERAGASESTGRRPVEVRRTKQLSRAGGVRCRKSDSALRTPRSALKSVCPDLILPKHRLAVFVHGCFWHRHPGCKNCTTPTARRDWWLAKLNGNAARDQLHQRVLRQLGWRTLVVWECETEKAEQLERLQKKLAEIL